MQQWIKIDIFIPCRLCISPNQLFKINMLKLRNPITVFSLIWIVCLIAINFRVSEVLDFDYSAIYQIFFLSIFAYISGYFFCDLLIYRYKNNRKISYKNLNPNKLFYNIIIFGSVFIILLNLLKYGPFPISNKKFDYFTYGSFKAFLFPSLLILFIFSDVYNKSISIIIKIISITILFLYISRGFIVILLSQVLITKYFLNKKLKFSKFVIVVSLFILITILLFGYIGELRTGNLIFINVMEIRKEYIDFNPGFLWILAYLSMPFANLNMLINHSFDHTFGLLSLQNSFPSFLHYLINAQTSFYRANLPNKYNTVPTYLGEIFIDYSYFGVILINVLLGFLGRYIYQKYKLCDDKYLYGIYISFLLFIPFDSNLFYFPFLLQYLLVVLIQKRYKI